MEKTPFLYAAHMKHSAKTQNTHPQLVSALIRLKKEYIGQLKERVAVIDELCAAGRSEMYTLDSLLKLMRIAHKLSESGKTFDLPSISDTGAALEQALSVAVDEMDSGFLSPATHRKVSEVVAATTAACRAAIEAEESVGESDASSLAAMMEAEHRQVLLIAVGSEQITDPGKLQEQLQYLGYETRIVGSISDLSGDEWVHLPSAAIIITTFTQGDRVAIRNYLEKRSVISNMLPPILYITAQNDFQTRLTAVRLQGDAFITTPVDNLQLIDNLGALVIRSHPCHYHVLIIDNDEVLANRYGLALERAGMTVTILTDPKLALQALSASAVDLVLMDFHMPGCNGFELACMLRQMEHYIHLPIVFLATEVHLDFLLRHAHLGIDDFITKPVSPEHLVGMVTGRAVRSSLLHKFMDQDSATGLLNHTRLKKELVLEVGRSTRKRSTFSYALLDIDHFKLVNDTFGHATGDVVIQAMAHLLRERLRYTDVIARYGGEEFGVILPDADAEHALSILLEVQKKFAAIAFPTQKDAFHVTFSGGIAEFPAFNSDAALSIAADRALYAAKKAGRNQLLVAPAEKR